jgi:hypothetical protein
MRPPRPMFFVISLFGILLGMGFEAPTYAQSPCADAAKNLDWQWTENSPPEKKRYDWSPAAALDIYWRTFHYDPQHGLVGSVPSSESAILASLAFGQQHNPSAQKTYRDCRAQQPSLHAFLRLVVTAAPGRSCNLADAGANIAWQAGANHPTITDAKKYWTQSATATDPAAKLYFGTLATDSLIHGQMHNPPVIQGYRACFRDNPNGLFAIVMQH